MPFIQSSLLLQTMSIQHVFVADHFKKLSAFDKPVEQKRGLLKYQHRFYTLPFIKKLDSACISFCSSDVVSAYLYCYLLINISKFNCDFDATPQTK